MWPSLVYLVVLGTLVTRAWASPAHYLMMHASPAVKAASKTRRMHGIETARLAGGGRRLSQRFDESDIDCGTPADNNPMWFTQAECSIASLDGFAYLDDSGEARIAEKGDMIKFACDDVFCPTPARPDCYELQDVCKNDEFCWINQHEKWGPWAMGTQGATYPLYDGSCSKDALQAIKDANVSNKTKAALLDSYHNQTCTSGITLNPVGMEVWKPIRGQCMRYRQEQQSCMEEPLTYSDPALNPRFHRLPNGQTFERPLLCDPRGGPKDTPLVCTGPDYDILPSTCVTARPKDICFSGPWWYSLECPRTARSAPAAGMTRKQVMEAAATAVLMFPGEVAGAYTCIYWDNSTTTGRATEAARNQLYAILANLWPTDDQLFGPPPTFDEVMAGVPSTDITDDISACYENENVAGSDVAKDLAEMNHMTTQPNKIWSIVHLLMHNQPAVLTNSRIESSKAMASFLLENFWCDDCRGFFYGGIITPYGMPPDSNNPESHARWWWFAHNVASEHVANIRGGHPWIHQLGAPDVEKYQNPFFMTFSDAVEQWTMSS